MNKELDALQEIGDYVISSDTAIDYRVKYTSEYEVVESALEDYQLHKEILNDYGFTLVNFREACFLLAQFRGSGYTGIENKLKALEIIKEKGLDIREFRYASSLYEYNICKNIGCKELTQEEFDLLKKVLK